MSGLQHGPAERWQDAVRAFVHPREWQWNDVDEWWEVEDDGETAGWVVDPHSWTVQRVIGCYEQHGEAQGPAQLAVWFAAFEAAARALTQSFDPVLWIINADLRLKAGRRAT